MNTAELIHSYFDAFNRHDAEGMINLLDENVAHDVNEGGREVGKDAFRRFKSHMDDCYREHISDLVIMVSEDGVRGTAEFTCSGEYLKTDGNLPEAKGQKYAIPAAAIFESANGKITRITSYYSLKGWIEAIS